MTEIDCDLCGKNIEDRVNTISFRGSVTQIGNGFFRVIDVCGDCHSEFAKTLNKLFKPREVA